MTDSFGRRIDYLRVSVTDRCNLRCCYCMPEDLPLMAHDDILRYEEILRVCAAAAAEGIRTVKVTGGEPLCRLSCVDFLRELKHLPGIDHVTLTTNGVLLATHAAELADMGLDGVNISLDTLDPESYRRITGRDSFADAWRGLEAALAAGLQVKVNVVPLPGSDDEELPALAALAERYPLDVRFIMLMPIGSGRAFVTAGTLPTGAEILERLREIYPDLVESGERRGFGPARHYGSAALKGKLGFIDAVGHSFCADCNRVRLTSTGTLKLCLLGEGGVELRPLLRGGADEAALRRAIVDAVARKPQRQNENGLTGDGMSRIGG